MEKKTIKIRIGRGSFNDIVINDNSVQTEHCSIIHDKSGYLVVNTLKESKTFINNKRINWEDSITPNDELRVGNSVVNWQQIEQSIRNVENTGQDGRKKLFRRVVMFIGYYAIYFLLGWFVLYSFFSTASTTYKIVSMCLYVGFVLYTIEPSKRNKKKMTEEDIVSWKMNKRVILITTVLFLVKFVFRIINHHI